jgi:hypothetical protein
VRSAALEAAAAQSLDIARPALEKAARDPDRRVRLKVIELVGSPGGSSGNTLTLAGSLLRRLAHDVDVAVRARASALLSRMQHSADASRAAPPPASPSPTAPSGTAEVIPEPASPLPRGRLAQSASDGVNRTDLQAMLRAGSEPFLRHDFAKAQKALERLSSLCSREPAKVCAPIGFELSYYLGRAHEAQGQLTDAMTEFQRLAGKPGGTAAERRYVGPAVTRLSSRLGRVEVKQLSKGRCQTTVLWVLPGEQEVRVSAHETRTVKVGANQQTTVGTCK